jgi:GNAT superfamily N-acetyltransferase
MTVLVRPLAAADKSGWIDLFRQYIVFYEETVPDHVVELTWQRLVQRSDGMMGFSAIETSGQIVGIAVIIFHRSTWASTEYCYMEDLFVAPAQRGLGVGRALIEAVYAEADHRGAERTYWVTAETNTTARRLYDDIATLTPFVQYRRDKPE